MSNQEQEKVDRLAHELEEEAAAARRLNGPNVVPFVGSSEKEKEPPSHAEILAMLLQMDDVQYERFRRAKAREWGMRLSTLDRIREEAVRQRREFAPEATTSRIRTI